MLLPNSRIDYQNLIKKETTVTQCSLIRMEKHKIWLLDAWVPVLALLSSIYLNK
jgi:hypothetical protein